MQRALRGREIESPAITRFFRLRRLGALAKELNLTHAELRALPPRELQELLVVHGAWEDWRDDQVERGNG